MAYIKHKAFDTLNHFIETSDTQSILVFGNCHDFSPKFTIAIPTYRRPETLRDALDSALNQDTDMEYEVLVIDNNPERNDDTELLMKQYSDRSNLTYYKNQRNIGGTGNLNRLYELARGKWVVQLHDDDMLSPEYLKVMSSVVDRVGDECAIFPSYTSILSDYRDTITAVSLRQLNDWHFLKHNYIGPPIGMCICREKLMTTGGFDDTLFPSADYAMYLKCLYNGIKVIKIDSRPIAFYRWAVNESLHPETLKGFKHQDEKLRSAILQQHGWFCDMIMQPYKRILNYQASQLIDSMITKEPCNLKLSRPNRFIFKIYNTIMYRYFFKDTVIGSVSFK